MLKGRIGKINTWKIQKGAFVDIAIQSSCTQREHQLKFLLKSLKKKNSTNSSIQKAAV